MLSVYIRNEKEKYACPCNTPAEHTGILRLLLKEKQIVILLIMLMLIRNYQALILK